MNEAASLDRLTARLDELEMRIRTLEHRQIDRCESAPEAGFPAPAHPSTSDAASAIPQGASLFSVLGKAMLGIAGAYLLRALSESGWIPEALLAPFAIAYPLAWLAAAASATLPIARTTYACTSALIQAPMLWELTMRFKLLPTWAAALALAAMTGLSFALARTAENTMVQRIANLATTALALTLAVATHDNLPFLAVLLLLAAVSEYEVNRGRNGGLRGVVMLAANLGVWMLIYIYRGPGNAPADYPVLSSAWLIAPGLVLFGITGASATFTAGVRHARITAFATVQTVIAFLLASCGVLYFGPAERVTLFGISCLVLAAAAYACVFTFLRQDADVRNHAVFATWGMVLFVAGSLLAFPSEGAAVWLGLSALTATAAGDRFNIRFLVFHGNACLLGSAIVSGMAAYVEQALAGTQPGAPSFAEWFALGCAIACYGLAEFRRRDFAQQASYVFAGTSVLGIAALLAWASIVLARLWFVPASHHVALIRSLIVCAVALALAFSGSRWQRRELTHIAYAAVVLEALKLMAEDLRHGHPAYIAASVCLFAITLIALPRLVKRSKDMESRNVGI